MDWPYNKGLIGWTGHTTKALLQDQDKEDQDIQDLDK